MKIFFIEENKKQEFWKKIFKKIEIIDDKIILNEKIKKMKQTAKIKRANEICKIIRNNNIDKIIISKKIKEDKEFVNLLYSNQNIVEGRILFKILVEKIIQKICCENKIKKEETNIGIIINNLNEWGFNLIENLSKKFKMVNVVTNKMNYLKKIQTKLYNEQGIIITATNNKKKALFRAKLIINVDCPEELLNKYVIYDNSILINLEEEVKIKKKRFCGKIINDYNISFKENSEIYNDLQNITSEGFDNRDLAEIYIMNKPKEIENIIIV